MESSMIWIPIIFSVLLVIGAVAAVLLIRMRPRLEALSPEERAEMAAAPMPRQQKRACWGMSISVITLSVISAILFSKGAAEYWVNDDLRTLVVGIFIGGLLAYAVTLLPSLAGALRKAGVDEVDQLILARTPNIQSAAMLVALAVWLTALTKMFHEQGAVPIVYLYLMFGSVILVNLIAQSTGIVIGYWLVARHAQG